MAINEWRATLRRDLAANRSYPKSTVVMIAFRCAQAARGRYGPLGRLSGLVVGASYKILSEWLLGVELPASTSVGPGLRLRHGVGLVVNPATRIGADVMLRHGVTLGNRCNLTDCPVIGDGVEIGAGATIVGAVTIGAGARIGPGVVVIEDIPAGATVHAAPVVVRSATT